MSELQTIIENAFENRDAITPNTVTDEVKSAVEQAIELLDSGKARVAEKIAGEWVVHQWLKKAVLLSFRIRDNELMNGAETQFWDKVDSKFASYSEQDFRDQGMRVVPPAAARKGSFSQLSDVLLSYMPQYFGSQNLNSNLGAQLIATVRLPRVLIAAGAGAALAILWHKPSGNRE